MLKNQEPGWIWERREREEMEKGEIGEKINKERRHKESKSENTQKKCKSLGTPGQITCFVDFLSENKLTHSLQRTQIIYSCIF